LGAHAVSALKSAFRERFRQWFLPERFSHPVIFPITVMTRSEQPSSERVMTCKPLSEQEQGGQPMPDNTPGEATLETTWVNPLTELDDVAQQALLSSVTADYTNWKAARSQLENTWRECWEAYLCDMKSLYAQPDEATPDRSRIVRPVLYEAVEAIHANLLNALFPSGERFFSVLGRTEADHENARVIEEFLRLKLEEIGFVEQYAKFLNPLHSPRHPPRPGPVAVIPPSQPQE
jgi:hypothetical protein